MSLITKITTYNAPYEIASSDRFYKDIDNKLENYKVMEGPKFSVALTSTTVMSITVTDDGNRASYMRVESTIFKNTAVSYWFLTAVTREESSKATQYSATLDAIATFGEQVFEKLDGQNIKIDRMHEDRYLVDPAYLNRFEINSETHSLINSDFKLGDTKGVELVFDGSKDDESTGMTVMDKIYPRLIADNAAPTIDANTHSVNIDNRIIEENKVYYVYALIQSLGSPEIYGSDIHKTVPGTISKGYDFISTPKDALRSSVVAPVDFYNSKSHNYFGIFENLQEGKVVNIFKLPFKLKQTNGFQLVFNKAGDRLMVGSDGKGEVILDGNLDVFSKKTSITNTQSKANDTYNEIFCFKDIHSTSDTNVLSIDASKLKSTGDFMDFTPIFIDFDDMKKLVENGETERLEIGLLNPDIMPVEMMFGESNVILDIYNYFRGASLFKILGKYSLNEMGSEITIKISDNQYLQWSENELLSFTTNQGATYLARNKYTVDAQRKGIDIQKDLSVVQARSREAQAGAAASNPVSALMSFGASTAGSAAAAAYAGQEAELQKKLAANKKLEIQATINDASASAPSIHTGTVHNLANLNTLEYKHNFNWVMKKPNKFLRDKMVKFYDRHGYLIHDWILFKKEMVENRKKFNYIEMDEFKDFVGTFADFDINVLTLLDAEFKKGLRLWHEDIISYNDPNIEISIETAINQLP